MKKLALVVAALGLTTPAFANDNLVGRTLVCKHYDEKFESHDTNTYTFSSGNRMHRSLLIGRFAHRSDNEGTYSYDGKTLSIQFVDDATGMEGHFTFDVTYLPKQNTWALVSGGDKWTCDE